MLREWDAARHCAVGIGHAFSAARFQIPGKPIGVVRNGLIGQTGTELFIPQIV
ncbi:hypothetical protein [Paraburkholderia sacchari]|uniref:hypothetical protein n=1 Tax=Paraburkholderia sacchari TaxID=159450 RepID=UPI001BCB726E|nr:hypothetical protein [Paraburkholderia sacchari]